MSNYKREMDVCEAIGRIEGVHGENLKVGEAYCHPTDPFPQDLTAVDWVEFLNALTDYMEVREMNGRKELIETWEVPSGRVDKYEEIYIPEGGTYEIVKACDNE